MAKAQRFQKPSGPPYIRCPDQPAAHPPHCPEPQGHRRRHKTPVAASPGKQDASQDLGQFFRDRAYEERCDPRVGDSVTSNETAEGTKSNVSVLCGPTHTVTSVPTRYHWWKLDFHGKLLRPSVDSIKPVGLGTPCIMTTPNASAISKAIKQRAWRCRTNISTFTRRSSTAAHR